MPDQMPYQPWMSAAAEAAAVLKAKATDYERLADDQPDSQRQAGGNLRALAAELREAAQWLEDGKP